MKKCGNCKHRYFESWGCIDCCLDYELLDSEESEIECAMNCSIYEEGTPDCLCENDCPSSTCGDYSPSNPWDAPGMSIKDFI